MRHEIPVMDMDGTVAAEHQYLLDRLGREAVAGRVRVNAYYGVRSHESEAFYTLSDGTILHEVNSTTPGGTAGRYLGLVVHEPGSRLFQRLRTALGAGS